MKTITVYEIGDRVRLRVKWHGWHKGEFAEVIAVSWVLSGFEPTQCVKLRGATQPEPKWFDVLVVEPDQEPRR